MSSRSASGHPEVVEGVGGFGGVAEGAAQDEGLLVIVDGLLVVAAEVDDVAQAVQSGRFASGIVMLAVQGQGIVAVDVGGVIFAQLGRVPAHFAECVGFPHGLVEGAVEIPGVGSVLQGRGYNALIFEGPGQGSLLFQRQIPFRHDWENVITPVVDYLRSRPDVDHRGIALNGSSLGGELVIRAAAFEQRLAAVVADPAILSVWLSWQTGFPSITDLFDNGATKEQVNVAWQQEIVPHLNPIQQYNFAKRSEPYGRQFLQAARSRQIFSDLYDFGTTVMRFTVADVAHRVTAPTLVTAYDNDALVIPATGPSQQGKQVYQLLRCDKQFHQFSALDGADQHCAPMAPQTRNQVVYDWLDGHLSR